MKKIISLIAVVVMLASMFTVPAFAADVRTLTLATTDEDLKVNAGDEFDITVSVDTSNTIKTIGFKIAFDPNDIELGTSASADLVAEEYADFIGTEDFPTLDSACIAVNGYASYVDDGYISTYGGYASTKNLGAATVGFEEKDGLGKVGFGYAVTTAKNALNKIDNMVIGGAVLKVKTTEAKQTTITIVEASSSNKNNELAYSTIANEIVLNLNGYGEVVEPEVPTAADLGLFTDASQNFKVAEKVMTSNGYSIEKALGFVSGIYADAAVVTYGTEITCEGFDKVLEIPAVNTYEAMENVKGFVAAVTSIRNDNLNKTFTAKAYADVTVGEETVRIYAEEAATAVYGN